METATCREGDDLGGELGEGDGALCTVYVGLGCLGGVRCDACLPDERSVERRFESTCVLWQGVAGLLSVD